MLELTLRMCLDTELEFPSTCNLLMIEHPSPLYEMKLTLGRETINVIEDTIKFIKETGADGVLVKLSEARDKVILTDTGKEVDPGNFGLYFFYDPEFGEADVHLVMVDTISDDPYPHHRLYECNAFGEKIDIADLSKIAYELISFFRLNSM